MSSEVDKEIKMMESICDTDDWWQFLTDTKAYVRTQSREQVLQRYEDFLKTPSCPACGHHPRIGTAP